MVAERSTTATTKGSCTNERNASKPASSGGGGIGVGAGEALKSGAAWTEPAPIKPESSAAFRRAPPHLCPECAGFIVELSARARGRLLVQERVGSRIACVSNAASALFMAILASDRCARYAHEDSPRPRMKLAQWPLACRASDLQYCELSFVVRE